MVGSDVVDREPAVRTKLQSRAAEMDRSVPWHVVAGGHDDEVWLMRSVVMHLCGLGTSGANS